MLDKKIILAPAKLNIFLKILGKRNDGYHEIRSGITFINLFDQIEIEENNEMTINYTGEFKPKKGFYDDCIIKRTLNFLNFDKNLKLKINIIKNIPVQGGLGSASTNAATIIKFFEDMNLIKIKPPEFYAPLGADIPSFLFRKDCFVSGIGDNIFYHIFPKYFFLLVKPKSNNSTKKMYQRLKFNSQIFDQSLVPDKFELSDRDNGNDFEEILKNENEDCIKILHNLENLENTIFARMTGSGSCCFAVFEKKEYALNAKQIFKLKFNDLWAVVCENNNINN